MKASEIKRGSVIEVDGAVVYIGELQVQTASSRSGNTLYKVRGQDILSRQKFEASFKGDDPLADVDISRRAVQLLYRDSDGCTFMDTDSYEQYTLPDEAIEEELSFLTEGLEGLTALIADGALLGIELPATAVLEIVECAPAMKAASSSARTKPATLSTGVVVQVPEYLTPGEKIKINVETREFIARA